MSSTASATAGMFMPGGAPVPLRGVQVNADVSGLCARVQITQRYVNLEATAIEAVYVFPLDETAAVCGFEAFIDGQVIEGQVKPRDAAFDEYDEAIAGGHGAFLLDEQRPDVFTASVGNLLPGKEVLLRLVYVTELVAEGSAVRFVLPTTVSPRYRPADDTFGTGRSDVEALSPPLAWAVPYGLDVTVRIARTESRVDVESPSHPIRVASDDRLYTVTLSQEDAALDRDFVLLVGGLALDTPQAWIERDDKGGEAVAVSFCPRLEKAVVPSEVIFLVDRSGSMDGSSIQEVRRALQVCLRSMSPGCRFNIIGYGSVYSALFAESRLYDDSSLAEATVHVGGMEADMGGTEILEPLRFALESPLNPSLPRNLIVLTDGQVFNTDAVLALTREHANRARVFTFGIGAGASHHLVRGMARAGGGAAESIYPSERIEAKVVRQFGRLLSPQIREITVDWGGLTVTQAPSKIPPAFDGSPLRLYALAKHIRPATIRLSGMTLSGPVSFDVSVDPARAMSGRSVATLAARERIRELEESSDSSTRRGSRQQRGARNATPEIISLATKYGLMSRETSFVAVEKRETQTTGQVKLRRVPIALTAGWGALKPAAAVAAPPPPASYASPGRFANLAPSSMAGHLRPPRAVAQTLARLGEGLNRARRHMSAPAARPAMAAPTGVTPKRDAPSHGMHALIALQHADGSWDLTANFAAALGLPLATLEAAAADRITSREHRSAWATALAVIWLCEHESSAESEWRLLAQKARRWLEGQGAAVIAVGWIPAAERFYSHRRRDGTPSVLSTRTAGG